MAGGGNISEIGEFGLIGRIRRSFSAPEGCMGIGDDCAVIPQKDGRDLLVSTDMLVEGVHFLKDDIDAFSLGWKSAAVNISDIAAMGGRPFSTFLSIALPGDTPGDWVEDFMKGYREISNRFGVSLLGGDTTSSNMGVCINVTVLGECGSGRAVLRSGALPGDRICVTGNLGDSGAGLKLILEGGDRDPVAGSLVMRHYRPVPRVEEGIKLASRGGVGAMMDISDGLASDLRHIMDESHVGARVFSERIPISPEMRRVCGLKGWNPLEIALEAGEDYELLFTVRPGCVPCVPHFVIGEITEGKGLVWEGGDRDYCGFRHF